MNWGVLIAVLIYEVVSIVGIGAFMAYKNKKNGGAESGSFAFAGGGLPGFSGRYHTCPDAARFRTQLGNLSECSIYGSYRCMVWYRMCNYDGSHHTDYRSMDSQNRAKTIGDFLNKVFGKVPGTMISCVNAALSIAMVCLEVETIAITLSFLTGWSYMISAIVGGILAMLYVLLAGMKDCLAEPVKCHFNVRSSDRRIHLSVLQTPGWWDQVETTMTASADTSWMTSIFGNKALIIGFAIPSALGATMFHGMAQTGYQPVATAKTIMK